MTLQTETVCDWLNGSFCRSTNQSRSAKNFWPTVSTVGQLTVGQKSESVLTQC